MLDLIVFLQMLFYIFSSNLSQYKLFYLLLRLQNNYKFFDFGLKNVN